MEIVGGAADARGLRVGLVVSRYHDFITDRLRDGALDALRQAGAGDGDSILVVTVPGAFELPQAARHVADSSDVDAIVCLGCLIRGQTLHFEYIASAVAHGLTTAATMTGVPMSFGVLTTNSVEEAVKRAGAGPSNKGWEAALAAVEMATLRKALARPGARDVPV